MMSKQGGSVYIVIKEAFVVVFFKTPASAYFWVISQSQSVVILVGGLIKKYKKLMY